MMQKLAKQSKKNVILLVELQVGLSSDGGGGIPRVRMGLGYH